MGGIRGGISNCAEGQLKVSQRRRFIFSFLLIVAIYLQHVVGLILSCCCWSSTSYSAPAIHPSKLENLNCDVSFYGNFFANNLSKLCQYRDKVKMICNASLPPTHSKTNRGTVVKVSRFAKSIKEAPGERV